jgi:hypothetical protein
MLSHVAATGTYLTPSCFARFWSGIVSGPPATPFASFFMVVIGAASATPTRSSPRLLMSSMNDPWAVAALAEVPPDIFAPRNPPTSARMTTPITLRVILLVFVTVPSYRRLADSQYEERPEQRRLSPL